MLAVVMKQTIMGLGQVNVKIQVGGLITIVLQKLRPLSSILNLNWIYANLK